MQNRKPIFLSYSRNDPEAAANLRSQLEQGGLSVFKDDQSIREGDLWLTRLQEAVDGCSGFVVLVGRDGVGRWIGAETQVALIRYFGPHDDPKRLPIFPVLLGDARPESLPAFLRLFQVTPWNGSDPLPDGLLEQIRERRLVAAEGVVFEGCPYVGLDAFRIDQARLFFGRQKETLEALACFETRQDRKAVRWLEINGNSGCGKSSLMNAGLLPLVEQGWLWPRTRIAHWLRIGPMMPGQRPVAMLAESLARFSRDALDDPLEMADIRDALEKDDRALAEWLRGRKRDNTAFLLALDQFEELFTFADKGERQHFDRLLAAALGDADCPLYLLSTVRADFLDRFDDLPSLIDLRNRLAHPWTLPLIGDEAVREIIAGPARLADLDVSEVRDAMVADAHGEPGALPLVENALEWLWERREGNRLSGRRYMDQGRLAGILSGSADALLRALDPKRHKWAQELLFNLVKVDPESRQHTRRRIPREEAEAIAGGGDQGRDLVDLLSGFRNREGGGRTGSLRLITVTEETAAANAAAGSLNKGKVRWVSLIHETLIRSKGPDEKGKPQPYWPTLWNYIEANKNRAVQRERLELQAREWRDRHGLARLCGLAGWRDLGRYRRLSIPRQSDTGRFLAWSRRRAIAQLVLLAALTAFVRESYLWTRRNQLPPDSMAMQQRFRLGYAPVPKLEPIPTGSFDMGEQDREFLKRVTEHSFPSSANFGVPGRHVDIAEAFSLGKYEVTYEEFDYYVWEQQRAGRGDVKYPTTAKGGRGRRPVVNVPWTEATAYAQWLGERTHRQCRLPTEAEWEYAARAGTRTAYPWGDAVRQESQGREEVMTNCKGCGSGGQSAPVGTFPPNAFGLYDMSGNVCEWTCSLWREQFDGSEGRCADEQESDDIRVLRGGSWYNPQDHVRSAFRLWHGPGDDDKDLGFRVLCSSPILGH